MSRKYEVKQFWAIFYHPSSNLHVFFLFQNRITLAKIYLPHSEARGTHDIFAHNIVIKRYCDKKTFFLKYFFIVCELKIFLGKDINSYFESNNFLKKNVSLSQYLFIAFFSENVVSNEGLRRRRH